MYSFPGFERASGTRDVHEGPCTFFGLVLVAGAAGDTVAIYDGKDAVSGRLFHTFTAGAAGTQRLPIDPGVHFDRGIVAVGSAGVTEYTILYSVDPPDPMLDESLTRPMKYS